MNWTGLGPGRIKWIKGFSPKVTFGDYEMAYCSSIDYTWELPLLWSGFIQAKSLAEPMVQQGNKKLNEKRLQPAHKPILLYDAIYQKIGFPGMKVYDSHLGGGSNRISCYKNGYDFVASEIDPEHWMNQERRYKDYISQLKMFN